MATKSDKHFRDDIWSRWKREAADKCFTAALVNELMGCDLRSSLGISLCKGDLGKMSCDQLTNLISYHKAANALRADAAKIVEAIQ
jgi:hypothetical protein